MNMKVQYTNYKHDLNYNYEVTVGDAEPEFFSTRKEIIERYGMSLSAIRHVIQNIRLGKVVKERTKWEHYRIKNVCIPKTLTA
jgi:hypothetical protein